MENKVLSVMLSCPAESRKTVKQPFLWGILLPLIFSAMCQFQERLQKSLTTVGVILKSLMYLFKTDILLVTVDYFMRISYIVCI